MMTRSMMATILLLLTILPCDLFAADEATKSADDLFAQGDFDAARLKYEETMKSIPHDPKIVERLGFVHFFNGEYKKAIECFRKVIQSDPSRKRLMLNYISCSRYLMHDYAGAVNILEEAGPLNILNIKQMRHLAKEKPYQVESEADETVIPFLQIDPLPVVELQVHSKTATVFIDTGASQLIIDPGFAREINITPLSRTEMRGLPGGSAEISYGTVDRVSLGDITLGNVPVWIMPTRVYSSVLGRQIDGILGTEVLMQFLPTLDSPHGRLILRLNNDKQAKCVRAMRSRAKVPFIIDGVHTMYAQCFVNDRGPVLMCFDLGLVDVDEKNVALKLSPAALRDLRLEKPKMTVQGVGGGGTTTSGYVAIDSVRVGDLVRKKMTAICPEVERSLVTPAGYKTYGLVGHQFLKHYAWTIDFENRVFLFDF